MRLEQVDEPAQPVPHVEAALRLHPGGRDRGHHEREEDVEVLLRGECDGSRQRGEAEIAEASRLQILVQPQEEAGRAEKAPDVVAAEAGVVEEVRRERRERAGGERRSAAEAAPQEERHRRQGDAGERRREARREVRVAHAREVAKRPATLNASRDREVLDRAVVDGVVLVRAVPAARCVRGPRVDRLVVVEGARPELDEMEKGREQRGARSRPSSRSPRKASRKRRTARRRSFQNLVDRGVAAREGAPEVRAHRERVRAEVAFLERADEDVAHLVLVQELEDRRGSPRRCRSVLRSRLRAEVSAAEPPPRQRPSWFSQPRTIGSPEAAPMRP